MLYWSALSQKHFYIALNAQNIRDFVTSAAWCPMKVDEVSNVQVHTWIELSNPRW